MKKEYLRIEVGDDWLIEAEVSTDGKRLTVLFFRKGDHGWEHVHCPFNVYYYEEYGVYSPSVYAPHYAAIRHNGASPVWCIKDPSTGNITVAKGDYKTRFPAMDVMKKLVDFYEEVCQPTTKGAFLWQSSINPKIYIVDNQLSEHLAQVEEFTY